MMHVWDTALAVDELLDAFDTAAPNQHPLATVVPDRATTDLLSWAITGQLPATFTAVPRYCTFRPRNAMLRRRHYATRPTRLPQAAPKLRNYGAKYCISLPDIATHKTGSPTRSVTRCADRAVNWRNGLRNGHLPARRP